MALSDFFDTPEEFGDLLLAVENRTRDKMAEQVFLEGREQTSVGEAFERCLTAYDQGDDDKVGDLLGALVMTHTALVIPEMLEVLVERGWRKPA